MVTVKRELGCLSDGIHGRGQDSRLVLRDCSMGDGTGMRHPGPRARGYCHMKQHALWLTLGDGGLNHGVRLATRDDLSQRPPHVGQHDVKVALLDLLQPS